MKINTVLLATLGVGLWLMVAGCGTYNHTQYFLQGPPNIEGKPTAATPAQMEAVRAVMADIAKQMKFVDRTERSVIPNLVGTYGEEDNLNPITFTAHFEKGVIYIDIMHDATTPGETKRYQKVRDFIYSELKAQFPNDIHMAKREVR